MMKKAITYLFLLCGITELCSCKKDFLNVVPQGEIVATTTSDYNLILNNPGLYNYTVGGNAIEALMGDEVAAEGSLFNDANPASQNAFIWADDIVDIKGDTPFDIYYYLQNLYACNKIINEVSSAVGPDSEKKLLVGEAMANRAFIYFQLINTYAKPYSPVTATNDPGFPIITIANVNQMFPSRNTVQDAYDLIVSDLKSAIEVLPLQSQYGVARFGKVGAEALLGKVYIFMGKYSDALTILNNALADNAISPSPAILYDYNKEFAPGGKFYPVTFLGPSNAPGMIYQDNTEAILSKTFYNGPRQAGNVGSNFIVLTAQAQALFSPNDLRLNFYAAEFPYHQSNPSGRLSKYAELYVKFGVQISELYLLLAEAKVRTHDLPGAKADLETLRKKRMPATEANVPSSIATDQTALIKFVLDERIREFATEGYRWFDMRRLSVDPQLGGQTYAHVLYNNTGNTDTHVFTLRPERMTLKLPPYIMDANPQLVNNP